MTQPQSPSALRRWAPLFGLGLLIAAAYYFGLQNYFSLQNIAAHHKVLLDYVSDHLVIALIIYAGFYIAVVSLSLPGSAILSISGGYIFGWFLSAPITVVAATIGSTIVFQIIKTSLGNTLAQRAGPFVQRLSAGFSKDAFNYLLFLRLVPAFPFFAVNAVAGLSRINLRSFVLATFIGIIPGAYVFAWLGRGLGSVIEAQVTLHDACVLKDGFNNCPYDLSISSLVTPQLLLALAATGVLALVPIAFKNWNLAR
jgi:uncharacterized membrane protein YdjX (TVP38/TMEM64 family)